ncbi:MAG: hypothetical protein JNL28_08595 [Planctomycetes bacterium]|nr:hypothetical protein [Planctomycetota bacterium]
MTPLHVDRLNIGLMLASLALAFVVPFELFLFSYAVLGPLHYLTELSWLHQRDFFAQGKRDWWWIAGLVVLAVLSAQFVIGSFHLPFLAPYAQLFAFLAFAIGFVFVVVRDPTVRMALAGVILAVTVTAADVSARQWFVFSMLTTTILHVSLFTGAFMLFGALKSRSRTGYAGCVLLVVCCAVALFAPAEARAGVSNYVAESYGPPFRVLNVEMARFFSFGTDVRADGSSRFASAADLFNSSGGIAIMRLIAFTYTYHYLNWFSKTSIIGWHKVKRTKLALALVLWLASVALYAQSFELGARWLFALSYAHVLLEFPLNHRSFIGIGQELLARVRSGAQARA